MIETGEVKNQSELANKLGISRARVSQVLTILKLDEKLMSAIKQLGNPMHGKIVSISILNKYLKNPELYKNELLSRLFDDLHTTVVPVQPAGGPSGLYNKHIII